MAVVSALQIEGLFAYASKGFTLRCRIKILQQPFLSKLVACFINKFTQSVIPAKAGIQTPSPVSSTGQALRSLSPQVVSGEQGTIKEIGSCFHGKPWIPHQVRNDDIKSVQNCRGHYSSPPKICMI
jgi:hypothetical protein